MKPFIVVYFETVDKLWIVLFRSFHMTALAPEPFNSDGIEYLMAEKWNRIRCRAGAWRRSACGFDKVKLSQD